MGSDPPPSAKPRVVELFAGVGGFRLGMEANGFETVWANQWEPGSVAQHAWDAYVTRFYAGDHSAAPENGNADIERVMDLAENGEFEIPDHEVLVGGFPCFTAGTAILTEAGYRPIEQLSVGDRVLTHLGRWRRVTAVMSREADSTLVLRGQGFPDIRTTDEHPFWARRRGHRWDNEQRRDVRAFDEPRWIEAGQIDSSVFVSQVYPVEHPAPPVKTDQGPAFYWLVGRYLADGWRVTANGKGRVVIAAGAHEADEVERRIRAVYPCTPSRERTAVKFHITRSEFHEWLADFGHGAAGKRIPAWLYGIDRDQAAALLDGYATGDGHPWQEGWKATTVSRPLALGLALLVQKAFGVVASIHEAPVPATTTIEGRVVSQQKQYQLVVPPRNRSAFIEGDYGWKLVRSVTPAPGATVYNISVEEDESYVADGCVVHNCQDYSVAKTLNQALGLEGKKGVLWWQIHRILTMKRPPFFFLENVDRLLKSPASQRGRDFAIMLATLGNLGYEVEWRMVNAADYGFPQKRRRVYIVGRQKVRPARQPGLRIMNGVLGRALPAQSATIESLHVFSIDTDPVLVTDTFNVGGGVSPFRNAGFYSDGTAYTVDLTPIPVSRYEVLDDILEPETSVPSSFFVADDQLARWRYLKEPKSEPRVHKESGTTYLYQEGGLPFPDPRDKPARTILTGEGGTSPSRFKHIIQTSDGRYRRLTPTELEALNGFPRGWTDVTLPVDRYGHDPFGRPMPDGRRAFMMGNALVVGVVSQIAAVLHDEVTAANPVRFKRSRRNPR